MSGGVATTARALMHGRFARMAGLALVAILLFASVPAMPDQSLQVTDKINLERFMGRWYVIASIPTPFETDAFNATEDYEWQGDGKIATTFTYNKGALDGPQKVARPTGFVSAENDAIWKMQFLWPFKADYRVMYVDDDHSVTIIGREKRDYVWLMARNPSMDDSAYGRFVELIERQGYNVSELRRVPHSPMLSAKETEGGYLDGGD